MTVSQIIICAQLFARSLLIRPVLLNHSQHTRQHK